MQIANAKLVFTQDAVSWGAKQLPLYEKVIAAARKKSEEIGVMQNIAVVDAGGNLTAFGKMDGAWTGHPDQNTIAVAQFPAPNQRFKRPPGIDRYPNLMAVPEGVGSHTVAGSRAAARAAHRRDTARWSAAPVET